MMKIFVNVALLSLVVGVGIVGCKKKDASTTEAPSAPGSAGSAGSGAFKTEEEKVSYIIGYSTGKGFREQALPISVEIFNKGMSDGLSTEDKAKMTEPEMQKTMDEFRVSFMEKRRQDLQKQGEKNKVEGEKFLTENKGKPGIKVLESGLQYKVLAEGTGIKPSADASVNVEYSGRVLSGKEFDSSKKQEGGTAKFQVSRTIKGISEALQQMKVGDEWEIYVPSHLAYGEQNVGAMIGPNETLIFKMKLVSIDKPEMAKPTGMEPAKPANKPVSKK